MDLGLRRLLLVIISLIGGIASVFVIFAWLNAPPPFGTSARVDIDRYGYEYFVLTALPMALLIGLWLDYFMRTNILPEDDPNAVAPAKKERPGRQAAAAPAATPEE